MIQDSNYYFTIPILQHESKVLGNESWQKKKAKQNSETFAN